MLLKSHSSFDAMGDYDATTGALAVFSRKVEPARASAQISGVFDYIGEKRLVLFRLDDKLYVDIDGHQMPLERLGIDVQSVNGHRFLRVICDGNTVLDLDYAPRVLDPPMSDDPTAFVEEEDFDFGLFLSNVSGNRGRQGRLYTES